MKRRISLFVLFNLLLVFIVTPVFGEGNYDIIKLKEGISPYGNRAFNDGLIPVMYDGSISENGNWAYLTEEGNVFSHKYASGFDYSEGLTPIIKEIRMNNESNLKLGYMNRQGKIVIEPQYDVYMNTGMTFAGRFKNGEALVFKYDESKKESHSIPGYWYRIDKKGNRIKVDEIIETKDLIFDGNEKNGLIYNDKYSINFDSEENLEILGEKKEKVKFHKGKALITIKDGKNKGFYIISKKEKVNGNVIARKSNQKVILNDSNIDFNAYLIKGNNYFKLRDIAYILNGTDKQFEVSWNSKTGEIDLYPDKKYTVVGGEMKSTGDEIEKPIKMSSAVYLDDNRIDLSAYRIRGNNYFKLRDIGRLLDIGVDWDGDNSTVIINTDKGYSE